MAGALNGNYIRFGPVVENFSFIAADSRQGREILYDLKLDGGQVFRSIQSGERVGKPGDRIRWGIDTDAAFFFDEEGNRI